METEIFSRIRNIVASDHADRIAGTNAGDQRGIEGTTRTNGNGNFDRGNESTNNESDSTTERPKRKYTKRAKSIDGISESESESTFGTMGTDSTSGTTNERTNDTDDSRTDTRTRGTETRKTQTPDLVVKQAKPQKSPIKTISVKEKKALQKAGDISPDEMNQFICGVFGILSVVAGSHWAIADDEGEQIAKPLSIILNKQNKKAKDQINSMMAPMLLISAIGAIIIPRLMITISQMKERKKDEQRKATDTANRANQIDERGEIIRPENSRPTQPNNEQRPADGENGNTGVSSIPAAIRNNIVQFN